MDGLKIGVPVAEGEVEVCGEGRCVEGCGMYGGGIGDKTALLDRQSQPSDSLAHSLPVSSITHQRAVCPPNRIQLLRLDRVIQLLDSSIHPRLGEDHAGDDILLRVESLNDLGKDEGVLVDPFASGFIR